MRKTLNNTQWRGNFKEHDDLMKAVQVAQALGFKFTFAERKPMSFRPPAKELSLQVSALSDGLSKFLNRLPVEN